VVTGVGDFSTELIGEGLEGSTIGKGGVLRFKADVMLKGKIEAADRDRKEPVDCWLGRVENSWRCAAAASAVKPRLTNMAQGYPEIR
jgi:hypothetical protein